MKVRSSTAAGRIVSFGKELQKWINDVRGCLLLIGKMKRNQTVAVSFIIVCTGFQQKGNYPKRLFSIVKVEECSPEIHHNLEIWCHLCLFHL